MKRCLLQAYMVGSVEAAELYQKAFDAQMVCCYKNANGTYFHAELDVYGQILALSEIEEEPVPGNTMQFCLHFEQGQEPLVQKAYDVLKGGAEVIHPLGPCEYSPFMADLIDKFGVRWCLFV